MLVPGKQCIVVHFSSNALACWASQTLKITLRVAARFCETLRWVQALLIFFEKSHNLFLVNAGALRYNQCTKKESRTAMAERRKLKVYNTSGKNYVPTPTIILKGQWLKQYGFDKHTPIQVSCEEGKLIIEPREPDPEPKDESIENFISSLSGKQLRVLERSLQNRHR